MESVDVRPALGGLSCFEIQKSKKVNDENEASIQGFLDPVEEPESPEIIHKKLHPQMKFETPHGTVYLSKNKYPCKIDNCEEWAEFPCKAEYFYCIKLGCHKRICSNHQSKKWFLDNKHQRKPKVCVECETEVQVCSYLLCSLIPLVILFAALALLLIYKNS